jgi:hypothetical protein
MTSFSVLFLTSFGVSVYCPQHTTIGQTCENVYYLKEGGTGQSAGEVTKSDKVVRKGLRKSVTVIRELLRIYSKPGDTILELCCGSAPGARASVYEGRICVALDCDEDVVNAVTAHLQDLHTTVKEKLDKFEEPDQAEEAPLKMYKKKKKHKKRENHPQDEAEDDDLLNKGFVSEMANRFVFPTGQL